MTALTLPGEGRAVSARPRARAVPLRWEFTSIFVLSSSLLFAFGLWILSRHVVYDDAESRLTHAYMVFWDTPAKLASIGFVWPPFQTLALLPFVLIKPLATSMVALPLYSSLWAGLMIASLNRTLTLLGVPIGWRYALLLAWASNPLFLDYSANGMSEIQFLALTAVGMHYFIAWWLGDGRSSRQISVAGVVMGAAFLTRYEIGAWIALMAAGVFYVAWPRRRRWSDVEAPLLLFLAPTFYMAAVWGGVSMMVMGGGPLSWFTRAGDQGYLGTQLNTSRAQLTVDVVHLTAQISPALWVVPAGLVVVALCRRDALALLLAVAVALGAIVTLVLMLKTPTLGLLQPRYNIRSFGPLAIGAGALVAAVPPGWRRAGVGIVVIVAMLAALPITRDLMLRGPHGEERAFILAVDTGRSQEGTIAPPHYRIGTEDDKQVADWIDAHLSRPKSVLIDDASSPGVILSSGRPKLFDSLVDHGTVAWQRLVNDPWGRFRYMVVGNPLDITSGFAGDLISHTYPYAYHGHMPGVHVILKNRFEALVKLAPREPLILLLRGAIKHGGVSFGGTHTVHRLHSHR